MAQITINSYNILMSEMQSQVSSRSELIYPHNLKIQNPTDKVYTVSTNSQFFPKQIFQKAECLKIQDLFSDQLIKKQQPEQIGSLLRKRMNRQFYQKFNYFPESAYAANNIKRQYIGPKIETRLKKQENIIKHNNFDSKIMESADNFQLEASHLEQTRNMQEQNSESQLNQNQDQRFDLAAQKYPHFQYLQNVKRLQMNSKQFLQQNPQLQYMPMNNPFNINYSEILNCTLDEVYKSTQAEDYPNMSKEYPTMQIHPAMYFVNPKERFRRLDYRVIRDCLRLFRQYEKDKQQNVPQTERITLQKIAQTVKLNYKTIIKLYQDYRKDSNLMQRIFKINFTRGHKQTEQIAGVRMQALKKIIDSNPFLSMIEIQRKMNENQYLKNGKDVKNVNTLLRRMGFVKRKIIKIPKNRNSPENIEKRFQFSNFFKEKYDARQRIYYFDYTVFNYLTGREQAWCRLGDSVPEAIKNPDPKKCVSLIASLSQCGIIAWSLKSGLFNKEDISNFFCKLCRALGKRPQKQFIMISPTQIVIIPQLQKLASTQAENLQVIQIPPHTPQMNAMDNWFAEVRFKLKKVIFTKDQELKKELEQIIRKFMTSNFSNFYMACYGHAIRGILREQF